MNQGTQGYSLTEKTEGRKSRDTVSLTCTVLVLTDFTRFSQIVEGNFGIAHHRNKSSLI
jgi:hypothetical protein